MAVTRRKVKTLAQGANLLETQEVLSLSDAELLTRLSTTGTGISPEEAQRRQEIYGSNTIVYKKKRSTLIEFLLHFRSPVTIILIIAAIVSGILGDPLNAGIIILIVLVSIILDSTQEYRASKAAEALQKRVATTATVLRNGIKQDIEITELVPGDIIRLSAGDIIPADARIIAARDFFVDQSALTGESFPVEKTVELIQGVSEMESNKWHNYLFMGTSVTAGTATGVVVKTGRFTEYGEIVNKSTARKPETQFESGLRRFGYLIMQVTFVLIIIVFFVNAFFKRSVIDSLLFSVALAVGLTPGLLPVILSINLSRGAQAMSKKGVIVKRLAAIQNFGSMDILCSDKTGTLTENRVTVIKHIDIEGKDSENVFLYSILNSRFQTGLRSPLDESILRHEEVKTDHFERIDEVPFDFIRKRLSIIVREGQHNILITKGAPEEILKIISQYELNETLFNLTVEAREKIEKGYKELSSQGFRVLGVSYKKVESKLSYSVLDETNMVFLGFIAFTDPLKETAGESMELLRRAGVRLKILTGDSEVLAAKVCDQLGFQVYHYRRGRRFDERTSSLRRTIEVESVNMIESSEIQNMNDDALARVVERTDVFSRVTPSQKNRIMNALKANGHVVGYLGDGINDTPSMKAADVSISVTNAVDVAKETADIILLENDLKIIADGVKEGRRTFGNTMKYILMAISSNFGNMFSAAGASLFLSFLPMLPLQILFNNLLYSFAQLALPADNVDLTYIQRPQRLRTSFVRNFMLMFGPISSIFDFATFFLMLYVFKAHEPLFQTAWFIESLFTQTLVIFVIRTRTVPFFRSKPNKYLLVNIFIVLAIALILPFTPVAEVFKFVPLPANFLFILVGFIVVYLGLVELMKKWFYHRFGNGDNKKRNSTLQST